MSEVLRLAALKFEPMAFIPVVAAGIAAAAGVSIGGTAIGLAVSLKDRMKHSSTSITHLMNLTEGDHISLRRKGDLPFRHAIVVGPVADPREKLRLVYHSGSRASARVELIEVDLHDRAKNGDLFRQVSV